MSNELQLVSPIPPSVNHYLAVRAIIKNGKPMAMTYTTNEAKKYKKDFKEYVDAECWKQQWTWEPNKTQHWYVDTTYYFPRTDMDASNYSKCMFDAITETQRIWIDDNVVLERVQAVYYDSTNPRVEMVIHPVDYIGVFDNAPQLEEFKSHCIDCTRYERNCSLLKKAIEGRVQTEIHDGVCEKFSKNKGA